MSTFLDKLKMAGESVKAIATNVIHGEEVMVEPKVSESRLKICEECPELTNLGAMKMCKQCGCTMQVKVKFDGMRCPLGKW